MKIPNPKSESRNPSSAFTLIEVLIAMLVFFTVALAVLQLVVTSLGAARALQQQEADPGMVAAELSITNQLAEESVSGDFAGLFPDYFWERTVYEAGTNGLYQVDIRVIHNVKKRASSESTMSILLFRPGSGAPGGINRGVGR
ncbi:MAG TPA: prepilin-type N-terminal cleavage/methylation domain-containing protein [Candidatus Eisenbacteria bacterium]|jgi:hypothetical protein|nr:prepilin-type N-terminal cleavage/methylation domain-containing protein [Candidatus Eisenbacteria bacterium]